MNEFYHFQEVIVKLSSNKVDRNLLKITHNYEKTISNIQLVNIVSILNQYTSLSKERVHDHNKKPYRLTVNKFLKIGNGFN
jgi:hypothetical protein